MAEEKTATEGLAELGIRHSELVRRIDGIEQERREANQQRDQARHDLVQLERHGGTQAERTKLEKQLADAEATAGQPWPQRVEGARHAARDVDQERQQFIADHLTELVADLETAGQAVAERLTEHAQEVVDAYADRERIAAEISRLAATVGPLWPGDVARSRCEELARVVDAVLLQGGEEPPRLLHDPRTPRHGMVPAEAVA